MMQGMNDWAVEQATRGFFWRADGQADEACPGTLMLTPDGGATLDLFDWAREVDPTAQKPPALVPDQSRPLSASPTLHHRVLGAVLELGLVTLDRCVAARPGRSGKVHLSWASYRFENIFRGRHYGADSEMSLRSLGFCAAGLEQMLRGLDVRETTLDDGCRLRFVPDSDRTTAHAEIRPQVATSLLHLSGHVLAVRNFLTLARVRESAIYAMWTIEEDAPVDHKKVDIRTALPWNRPGVERGFIDPEMMLFVTDDVKANLADVVGRWISLCADYADAVDLYFTNQFMTHTPIHIKLSMLFRAVDAWYRVNRAVPDDGFTSRFDEALGDLINEYTGDLEMSFSILADGERVRKMRNEIIHPGRTTPLWDGDIREYVATERELTLLMQICMLREIGFSDDVVKGIVNKDAVKQLLHTEFVKLA